MVWSEHGWRLGSERREGKREAPEKINKESLCSIQLAIRERWNEPSTFSKAHPAKNEAVTKLESFVRYGG